MILPNNFTINISDLQGINFSCESGYIIDGRILIKDSYIWDGCTFAIDTDNTYIAGLIHDFLYEYKPVSRWMADKIFYRILRDSKFELSLVYYIGVRLFGWYWFNRCGNV